MCVLMRRHNQTLYRAARSILHDDGEAEDVVQDTYVHAYQAMASFRGDAQLSTWLTRIAINEALGRARKQRRRAEIIRLDAGPEIDRKSTRLNSSHSCASRLPSSACKKKKHNK